MAPRVLVQAALLTVLVVVAVTVPFLLASTSEAAPVSGGLCGTGTLEDFIGLSGACTAGPFELSNFTYIGATPLSSADIGVATLAIDDELFVTFSGPWIVADGGSMDWRISYDIVTPLPFYPASPSYDVLSRTFFMASSPNFTAFHNRGAVFGPGNFNHPDLIDQTNNAHIINFTMTFGVVSETSDGSSYWTALRSTISLGKVQFPSLNSHRSAS